MSEQPSIPVNQAFDPQERQAQKELNAYIESRPYEDAMGGIHDPANGKFINSDKYFDGQRAAAKEGSGTAYEAMPTTTLARKLGEAEFHGDQTTADSIEDVMLDKIGAQEEREVENAKKNGFERSDRDTDDILDHLDAVKERELQKLIEENLQPGENSSDKDSTDPENKEKPKLLNVYFNPEKDGTSRTAFEITKDDYELDLNFVDGQPTLITTDGTTYYSSGRYINDLEKMQQSQPGTGEEWHFGEEESLPKVTIGKPLTINGKEVGGPVTKVEIATDREKFEDLENNPSFEARGDDPFVKAHDILKQAYNWDEPKAEAEAEAAEVHPAQEAEALSGESSETVDPLLFEPGGIGHKVRSGIRNAMANAAAAMHVRALSAREYFSDKERGDGRKAVAGILGALALVGVGYAASKGISLLDGHDKEVAGSVNMKPHHHQAVQEAVGNGGTTAIAPGPETPVDAGNGTGGVSAPGPEAHAHKFAPPLEPGENPWTASEQELHFRGVAHPTDAQIQTFDQDLLHVNGNMTEEEARHLPVGTRLRLPQ